MNTIITVNEADLVRGRTEFLSGFLGSLDAKRPAAWTVYGYPEQVTFDRLLSAYMRGGPAYGAVHRLLDKCWQAQPRILQPGSDKEGAWEAGVKKVFKKVKAWKKLKDFDRRNLVGRYSALVYRVADGKPLSEPLERAPRLVDLVPLYEDQVRVAKWHSDPEDWERFGTAAMYQMRTKGSAALAAADTQGQPEQWLDVHPSRVQIMAEGSVGSMFDGVPLLLPAFNSLVDLEKITGGSAESFLKNSARTLTFEYGPDASPQAAVGGGTAEEVKQKHDDRARAINRNQDAAIVTQGAKTGVLQTTTHDPEGAWMAAANTFAAGVRMPFTVLFGQQTGRLASDEDKADMVERCVSRQTNELTPAIEEFVTRMQACGVLPEGEFDVEWPPLDAPSDKDRVEILKGMTAAMQSAAGAGVTEPVFVTDEMRKVMKYDPLPKVDMPPTTPEPSRKLPVVPQPKGEE